jgi:hypothetical protein
MGAISNPWRGDQRLPAGRGSPPASRRAYERTVLDVNVGTDNDMAAFAVASIRSWQMTMVREAHRHK